MLRLMSASSPTLSLRFLTVLLFAGLSTAITTAGCSSEDGDASDAGSGGEANTGGDAGTGGAASGGDAASGGAARGCDRSTIDYPTDSSLAGIEAFLAAESYKSAPWVGDPAPRDDEIGNPHGPSLQAYFNTAAAAASASNTDAAINAMVVKETYDPQGVLIGKLVRLKTGEGTTANDWVNYCYVSDNGAYCTGTAGEENPFYSDAGHSYCTACHGNTTFISPLPQ